MTDIERLEKKVDTLIYLVRRIVPSISEQEKEFEERLQRSINRGKNAKSQKKGD
jgi:hypothetical protein